MSCLFSLNSPVISVNTVLPVLGGIVYMYIQLDVILDLLKIICCKAI